MVFLTSPYSGTGHRTRGLGSPQNVAQSTAPGPRSCLPRGRTALRCRHCHAGQGSDPVVGPGGGHGGIDPAGVIVDDTLKTRPDLEEVTCDDDKQILPLTGRPVLP